MSLPHTQTDAKTVIVTVPHIGMVHLHKFNEEYDHGIYKSKPWHICTFGVNFATVDDCLIFLEKQVERWDEPEQGENYRHESFHSEMTHAFLATEASLDACPY